MTPGKTYHIYNHGNAEDNLFRSEENYRYFLQKYGEYISPVAFTYAFCLMPNHFHFLVKIKEELQAGNPISGSKGEKHIIQTFSNFFNAYTKAFNKMYSRRGKLFLTPFKRKEVTNNQQLVNTWKYVHYNAVHHRFVDDPHDWPHSSIHEYRLSKSSWLKLLPFENNQTAIRNIKPDWNDFLNFDY
ncbi:MAG: transposase [Cyclobacteriaceae bacterium]